MAQPIVSVIMPVYNGEEYLRQCVDSVINQTLKDIEIICVDDGSKDSSPEILKEYAAKDPRVKVITQANAGAGAARNNGLTAATGKYLSFLDSDDFFEPDMLEKAAAKIAADKADFVVFRCDQYLNDTNTYKKVSYTLRAETLPPYTPFSYRAITGNIFKTFVGWAWDKLYDADFVRKNGLTFQEQRTSNDMRFVFTALFLADKITWLDDVLVHQRRNNGASLSNTREKSWFCFYDALKALRENLKSAGKFWELEKDFINYSLHFSLWNINTISGPCYYTLYNKLKEEWFEDLGIKGKDASYFYVESEYRQYREIMNYDADQYLNKISVVIRASGDAAAAKKTVDSIFANTELRKEAVLLTAEEDEKLTALAEEEQKAGRTVRVAVAGGSDRALLIREGIAAAEGEYLHFVSAGDTVESKEYRRIWIHSDKMDLDFTKAAARKEQADEKEKALLAFTGFNKGFDDQPIDKRFPDKMASVSPVFWNGIYKKQFLSDNAFDYTKNDPELFADLYEKADRIVVTHRVLVRRA